ncbi:MAG: Slp family lipoprotein [Gammaproteobacteria bacterium]|nr:Slp family lipoprotein [Gammaproteobacteria bacterium]MBA3732027.1 Slp family lipoprotein [Gammaproteobacteria bacterium]
MAKTHRFSSLACALLLAACASGPGISTDGANQTVTPSQASVEMDVLRGDQVLWGGTIVNSTNLENSTRLEVLGYPLDGSQRPDTSAQPTGRFLTMEKGYLETVDYGQGRLVTIKGALNETQKGAIGEADYTYPVVQADRIYLWPEESDAARRDSGVNFGFGIGILF